MGGATSATIKALIHVIEGAVKVEAKLISILIDMTDGVDSAVTISGSKHEAQEGEGIIFTTGGGYSNDDVVAGYHIKDLYPEASNSGHIEVKGIEVGSSYEGKEAVCGIFHEQAGNGARQGIGEIAVSEKLKVWYSGANANVAGIWQKGDGTSQPPYFYENVLLNGVDISAWGTDSTAYGIVQDGNAHIDGNTELHGSVSSSGGNAFGVRGGNYGGNILADLTVQAGNGSAAGIYLTQTAGGIDGSVGADGTKITNADGSAKKATLNVTASADAVGIFLGGESTFDEDGNVTGETQGGNVSGAFANYDISVKSTSQDPENMAIGVYMHNGASVVSMSDLKISATSYYGPAAGFVYDNTGTGTMSVGATLSRLDISAETYVLAESPDSGRAAGIVIGKAVDFKVDASSITVKPGNGRDGYGLAYGRDVSGETYATDGGVGVFNYESKDSSGLEITNSQMVAHTYNTPTRKANAYGLYLTGEATYAYAGNEFTAISEGGVAYGLYAAGESQASNIKTLTAKDSHVAYGVYLLGAAKVDATTLEKITVASNSVGGNAYGIFIDKSSEGEFSNFTGEIDVRSFYGTAYGAYVNGSGTWNLGAETINVKRTENSDDFVSVKNEDKIGSSSVSGESETAYGLYVTDTAKVSVKHINVSGTGKLIGIWAGTNTTVSLLDGATINAAGGDALVSDGDMMLKSLGSAQLTGNVAVAGTLYFAQGTFSFNAGTIAVNAWKIGSAAAGGNFVAANVILSENTELVFYVQKPEARTTQDAVIMVSNDATFTALTTTINVVLDHNSTYGFGDVITLIGGNGNYVLPESLSVSVSQNGVALSPDLYDYGAVAGGWGITFIPEPSAFGLFAGMGALALVASRRRRKKA